MILPTAAKSRKVMKMFKKMTGKITRNWQITLPKDVRKNYGFITEGYVIFKREGKKLYIVPAKIVERDSK